MIYQDIKPVEAAKCLAFKMPESEFELKLINPGNPSGDERPTMNGNVATASIVSKRVLTRWNWIGRGPFTPGQRSTHVGRNRNHLSAVSHAFKRQHPRDTGNESRHSPTVQNASLTSIRSKSMLAIVEICNEDHQSITWITDKRFPCKRAVDFQASVLID